MFNDVSCLMTPTAYEANISEGFEDPLDADCAADAPIMTTRRGLIRVALIAAETASRFARDGIGTDPMAWMLAPRRMFDGEAAIDACLARDACLRGILLHGLSMGLDADRDEIDDLANDAEGDECPEETRLDDVADPLSPQLYTSFLVGSSDGGTVQAFDAMIALGRSEAEARLRARHGAIFTDGLEIVEGFDPDCPLSEALISPALADMLIQVAADPTSPLAEGLSVTVQQRFAA